MGCNATMPHASKVFLLLVCIAVVHARKGVESGGGSGDEGGSCQEVYMTLLATGVAGKIGLDSGQDGDDGVTLISAFFNTSKCIDSYGSPLPGFESTCDEDDDWSTCESVDAEYECTVAAVDWSTFRTAVFKLNSPSVDDCSEEPKCMGAPSGSTVCTFTGLPS